MTTTLRDTFAYLLDTGLAPPPQRERVGGRVKDGTGNGRAEWDWYFALSDSDRERYRRWMRGGGCQPDEWAVAMGYDDVETAMCDWRSAVDHQRARAVDRFGVDWDAEEPEPEEWEPESSGPCEVVEVVREVIVRERVLGLGDLADYVGAKRGTAYKWQHRGQLPTPDLQVSGADCWYLSTVDAWNATR